jgi:RNA polymerase sigma-70 factor (ECF subfamily)
VSVKAAQHPDRSLPAHATQLATAHWPVLEAYAHRLCKNRADAHDLVQDTFERALRYLGSGQTVASERGWLLTILHNQFLKGCRTRTRRPLDSLETTTELAAAEPEPPPRWVQISRDELEVAVAQLEPDFRIVFRLYALEGKSYQAIAAELGVPTNTIGSRLLRARKKLREILEPALPQADGHE